MVDIVQEAINKLREKYRELCREVFKEDVDKCPAVEFQIGWNITGVWDPKQGKITVIISPFALKENYDLALEYAESVLYHELHHAYLDLVGREKYKLSDDDIRRISELYASLKQFKKYPDSYKEYRCKLVDHVKQQLFFAELSYYGAKLFEDALGWELTDDIFNNFFIYNTSVLVTCMNPGDIIEYFREVVGKDNAMELAYIRTYLHTMSDDELIRELVKTTREVREFIDKKYMYLIEEIYKKYYR